MADPVDNHPAQPHFDEDRLAFVRNLNAVLADQAGASASGSGSPVALKDKAARVELDVTAADTVDGDEALDVAVESRASDADSWTEVHAFPTQNAVNTVTADVSGLEGHEVRAVWTVSGTTPSFDFTVTAV